jgi:hypothetical protein
MITLFPSQGDFCATAFRPSPPYIVDYTDRITPTLHVPLAVSTEGTALFGQVEQLWIFNQRSGKIYVKFN